MEKKIIIIMGILVFYCHNIRSVKHYSFTILQFLQVRILGMTQLDLPLRSHEAEIVVLTGAASSFYAAFAWGSIPDSLVAGRTQFFAVVGLKLSALRSHLPFPISWPSPQQANLLAHGQQERYSCFESL